jgi:hypothetical protein
MQVFYRTFIGRLSRKGFKPIQGENARDIEHFLRHLGYSPRDVLVCATRYGAELMALGG